MSQVNDRDVEAIKDWLAKEKYLPKTFNDLLLKKFLFSCDSSLERTKQCIDVFCTKRAIMSEIFTDRDTTSKKIQQAFAMTEVATYTDKNNEIMIYKVTEIPNEFDFYGLLQAFSTQIDNWLNIKVDVLHENQIIVLDASAYTLKFISKMNIFVLKALITWLLEGMPIRLQGVHFINCPSYYESIFNMLKPAFPDYLIKLMHFHPDHTGLYKCINKESLPKEYGGDSQSLSEQNAYWVNQITNDRKYYLNNDLWKADLSLREKNGNTDTSMTGSFKTLEID